MLLIADQFRVHKTEGIVKMLNEECNTEFEFVPGRANGLVQPVDVIFNAPFKAAVHKLATKHLHSNRDAYLQGKNHC